MEQGNFTAAKDVVNLLPIEHKVKNLAEAERVRMIDLITFLEQVTSSGRNESELNTVEIQQLESAIALGQDRPGAWARNILCFYYDHCVPPVTGWDDSNPKSNRPEAPTSTIETKPSLHVFPNPAETYVTFGYKLESAPTKAFLTVKDATGRMIATIPISLIQAQVAYDPRDLAKGLYTVELSNDGTLISSEKLVLQ
ncbi:MAG: T9SS type A sorting domain-containing protein [Flavobacteriales bacterium]|nr:T9SS type A sorting domain-containing protein [Flavobacteriales bacterium]